MCSVNLHRAYIHRASMTVLVQDHFYSGNLVLHDTCQVTEELWRCSHMPNKSLSFLQLCCQVWWSFLVWQDWTVHGMLHVCHVTNWGVLDWWHVRLVRFHQQAHLQAILVCVVSVIVVHVSVVSLPLLYGLEMYLSIFVPHCNVTHCVGPLAGAKCSLCS